MSIQVVTDSTCDLPEEIIAEYGITVIPLYINISDRGYLDGVEITRQEFYEGLPDYDPLPTTATPGIDAFRGRFIYRSASALPWMWRALPPERRPPSQ